MSYNKYFVGDINYLLNNFGSCPLLYILLLNCTNKILLRLIYY